MTNINIIVKINGIEHTMYVTPRCRLGTFIIRTEEAFNRSVTCIKSYSNYTKSDVCELTDGSKYMIEDYNIKNNHYVEVTLGDLTKTHTNPSYLESTLIVESVIENFEIKFNANTCLRSIIVICSNFLLKSTIQVYHNGILLQDEYKKLSDYGIVNKSIIKVEGVFFPKCMLKNHEIIDNKYISDECVICLEKNTLTNIFKCGHINVCSQCCEQYAKSSCPLCE
jgi:hypothetical protein